MLALFALHLIGHPVSTAYAQGTDVVCLPEYSWMSNSLGQNPCLVTSWLYTPCLGLGNGSTVTKLPPHFEYSGPDSTDVFEAVPCKCNTVVYSLLAACGMCQMGSSNAQAIAGWPIYASNCTDPYNRTYPEPIPDGTAIPEWAFLDVISNSNFNVGAAKSVAAQELPDITTETSSTATASMPASSASNKTGTRSEDIASSTGTQTTLPVEQSKSSTNVGAISGGIVGGVIGLLLVGALVLSIVLRHRRKALRDQSLGISQTTAEVREIPGPVTSTYPVPALKSEAGGTIGLYDPNDPRTYPETQRSGVARYDRLPQVMS